MITKATIQTMLEQAPQVPVRPAPQSLLGWYVPVDIGTSRGNEFVCDHCMGRLNARGCMSALTGAVPIWSNGIDPDMAKKLRCIGCDGW